jgi:hypothetical protein
VFIKSGTGENLSFIFVFKYYMCGPGSSVGIANSYGLDSPEIESQCGTRFFAPVQTGPRAHSACCKKGTGSFLGVESGQGVTLNPHPLLVPRSKHGRTITLLSISNFVACKKGETFLPNITRA